MLLCRALGWRGEDEEEEEAGAEAFIYSLGGSVPLPRSGSVKKGED